MLFTAPALAENVSLPKEDTPVRLKEFPGYSVSRKGQQIFMTKAGNTRSIGTAEACGAKNMGRPDILAHDLDADGVPEFFLLQVVSDKDSVYSLVHLKHGVGQKNYLFGDRGPFFFADPLVDAKKLTVTSRTSTGYTEVYVWKKPRRPQDLQYRLVHETFPESALSGQERERAAFFDDKGRLPTDLRPYLPQNLSLTFMPGALPISGLPEARRTKRWGGHPGDTASMRQGTPIAPGEATLDRRWVYVYGPWDSPSGWVPVKSLFVQTKESLTLLDRPAGSAVSDALAASGNDQCPGTLAAGAQLLIIRGQDAEPGNPWLEVRTACGRTGWLAFKQLRLPE